MLTCTKKFGNIPFAHRIACHQGHCRFVHGHNWDISVTFVTDRPDECGFVVDLGDLGWVKSWITAQLDHHLIIAERDPEIEFFRAHDRKLWLLTVIPARAVSTELLAEWMRETLDAAAMQIYFERDVRVASVRLEESPCNSAIAMLDLGR